MGMMSQPEEIRVYHPTEEELRIAAQAESLHISDDTHINATQLEQVPVQLQIDTHTGHVIDPSPDATAAYCAAGPDCTDPPSEDGRPP